MSPSGKRLCHKYDPWWGPKDVYCYSPKKSHPRQQECSLWLCSLAFFLSLSGLAGDVNTV